MRRSTSVNRARELLNKDPSQFTVYKISVNDRSELGRLSPSLIHHIAEILNASERLVFSNVCRKIRTIVTQRTDHWTRLSVHNVQPKLGAAYWERAGPEAPLHLSWVAYNRSHLEASFMRDYSDLILQFLPRLRTLSMRYLSSLQTSQSHDIVQFLAGGLDHHATSWLPLPASFVRWTAPSGDDDDPTTALAASNLQELEVDCGTSWTPESAWSDTTLEQHEALHWHLRWQLPAQLFGLAENPKLRRCTLRGTAFPWHAMPAFLNVTDFAFSGMTKMDHLLLDRILEAMPQLDCLALGCPFDANSAPADKIDLSRSTPPRVVLTGEVADNQEREALLSYFVRRGARDLISIASDAAANGIPGETATIVAFDLGTISVRYPSSTGGFRRIRRCSARHRGFDLKQSITSVFWLITVTELTIHEAVWECLVETAPTIPVLELVRIRFARRWDRLWLGMDTTSFFLARPEPGAQKITAPQLRTFEFAGDYNKRSKPEHPEYCSCCGAATISLDDVRGAVEAFGFPSLERIRVCNLWCTDVNPAAALCALYELVPVVEVELNEVFEADTRSGLSLSGLSGGDVFRYLDNPHVYREGMYNFSLSE